MTPTDVGADDVVIAPAAPHDLTSIAQLYLLVRAHAVPQMPPIVRTPAEVHSYVTSWDLAQRDVWVAHSADGVLAGFVVVEGDWVNSLYVHPEAAGQGIGSALLEVAKALRPGGFGLWVFESNQPARAFYARHGLVEVEHTDGRDNEERQPDVRMEWRGAATRQR